MSIIKRTKFFYYADSLNDNEAITFDDVLLVPQYTEIESRKDVDVSVELFGNKYSHPFIPSNMDTITDDEMVKFCCNNNILSIFHRFMSIDDIVKKVRWVKNWTSNRKPTFGVSVGISDDELNRVNATYELGVRIFCIDVAHGDTKRVYDFVKKIKEFHKDSYVVAGNVATPDACKRMESAGADAIKLLVGSGSVCLSRLVAGHGSPALWTVATCRAATTLPLICDGGIRKPADSIKALAFGANLIMSGYMFAGTDETPGSIYVENGKQVKSYRGMASKEAQEDFFGSMSDWKTYEGISTSVPYKGSATDVLSHYLGGLRSGMTYSNARNLKELYENAKYVKVSNVTQIENDVIGGKF